MTRSRHSPPQSDHQREHRICVFASRNHTTLNYGQTGWYEHDLTGRFDPKTVYFSASGSQVPAVLVNHSDLFIP